MPFENQIICIFEATTALGAYSYKIPEGYWSDEYSLTSAIIPYKFYYIRSGFNSRFAVGIGGTFLSWVDIPEGNYDNDEMAEELQSQLNTTSTGTWTVTYNNKKDIYEFNNNTISNFSFLFLEPGGDPSTHFVLGFGSATIVASSHFVQSSRSPRIRDLFIKLKISSTVPLEQIYLASIQNQPASFIIPLIVEFGDSIVYKYPEGETIIKALQELKDFTIEILDENDNLINLRGAQVIVTVAF